MLLWLVGELESSEVSSVASVDSSSTGESLTCVEILSSVTHCTESTFVRIALQHCSLSSSVTDVRGLFV